MKMLNQLFARNARTVLMILASLSVFARSGAGAPLAITTTSPLASGVVGTLYSTTLAASGGTTPYSWTIVAGALPPGLSFAASGLISGSPTTAGTFSFYAQVTDKSVPAQSTIAPFVLNISAVITPLLISSSAALPDGVVGSAYSQALAATGGVTPYQWSLLSGTLPAGLSLSSTGVISGNPTAQGSSTFVIQVKDSVLTTASQQFTLNVDPPGPARSGVLSQVASGGGWKTSLYLVNTSSSSVPVTVKFWSNAGTLLTLPLTVTQTSGTQVLNTSTFSGTVVVNDTLLIESDTLASVETTGWAEVISTGPITGYGVFHYTSAAGLGSEGTVPLEAAFNPSFILPYDAVGGLLTGVALTNLVPGNTTVVIATVWGTGGKQIASQKITLPAGGHTAFLLSTSFPGTLGNRGIVEFTAPSTAAITGLGLRVDPTGGITSIPLLQRP
jgi:hypothetical protein